MRTFLFVFLITLSACTTTKYNKELHDAIEQGSKDRVKILINQGVDLEPVCEPNFNCKPLGYAALRGELEIVKILLEAGADPNGRNAYGDVPFIKANSASSFGVSRQTVREIQVYLLNNGADPNVPNAFGISPMIGLCAGSDIELIKLALSKGGDINTSYINRTNQGYGQKNYTAFQAAVAYDQAEVVKLLLSQGGDPHLKDSRGRTSIEIARENGNKEILEILEKLPNQ